MKAKRLKLGALISAILLLFGLMTLSAPKDALAATDLIGPDTYTAWVDLRLSEANGEKPWLDDGFGKLRYGGNHAGGSLGQAAILWKPRFTDTVSGYVLLQDVPDAEKPTGVSEAYLKWKPVPKSDTRFVFRLGQMFPPVSMEHDGTGWTPSRTLTPSAINSWIGEEVLVQGIEGKVEKSFGDQDFALTVGAFIRNDTSGTILTWRGWALHDISASENTELPLPSGMQGYAAIFGPYQDDYTRPHDEVDHRTGYYERLDWRPPFPAAFNLEYYDNQGDPMAVRSAQWGWRTRFYNLGMAYQATPNDEVLSQYMAGHTRMGWEDYVSDGYRIIDARFDSAYVLWTHICNGGSRLTGRIDYFGVKDFSLKAMDDNTDKGYSVTVAWMKPINAHLNLAIEALHVDSTRPARITQALASQQAQTQLQIALKIHL